MLSSATLRLSVRVSSPVGMSVVGKAAEVVTLVLLLTLLPRSLGASGYGQFAIALALVQIGGASLSLGGPGMLSRFVPASAGHERAAVARSLLGRMAAWRGLGLAGAATAAVIACVVAPDVASPGFAVAVVLAIALDSTATLLAQGALSLGRTAVWSFRWPLQNLVLLVAAISLSDAFGPGGAIAALPIASGCAALVAGFAIALPIIRAPSGAPIPPGALRFGATLAATGILAMVMARGSVIAVVLLNGSTVQAGFAGLAVGAALAGGYAINQMFTVQLPSLAARAADDPVGVEEHARLLARTVTLVIAPATVILALAMEWLVPRVVGEEFRGAAPAFAVAMALLPFAPLAALAGQAADLRLRPEMRLRAAAVASVVFVLVALVAVPEWGAVGAAAALLAGTRRQRDAARPAGARLRGAEAPRDRRGRLGASRCWSGGWHREPAGRVDRLQPGQHRTGAVPAHHDPAAGAGQAPLPGRREQLRHGAGRRRHGAVGQEAPAPGRQLAEAAGARHRHHGHPPGHGLQGGDAERLERGGHEEDVHAVEPRHHVLLLPRQVHRVLQAQRRPPPGEVAGECAAAHHQAAARGSLPAQPVDHVEQQVDALLGREAGDDAHGAMAGRPFADSGARGTSTGVGNDRDRAGRGALGDHGRGHGGGEGHQPRVPRAQQPVQRPELAVAGEGAGGVLGVDGQRARQRRAQHDVRRHRVGVQVDRPRPQPPREPRQAREPLRIPPRPHPQAHRATLGHQGVAHHPGAVQQARPVPEPAAPVGVPQHRGDLALDAADPSRPEHVEHVHAAHRHSPASSRAKPAVVASSHAASRPARPARRRGGSWRGRRASAR